MDFDLRKPFIVLAIIVGICWYVSSYYTPQDVLSYTKKNRDLSIGPAVDYYIGMGYFMRSDYDQSLQAFNQLLTDYTTTQYTPDALMRVGEIHEGKFRWQEAKDAYQQYMTRFPEMKDFKLIETKYDQIKFK